VRTEAYHRPATLDDALALLAADPALVPLAGGTDVYPAAAQAEAWFQPTPARVLDLSALPLRTIERDAEGHRFGALATWSDVIAAALPPAFDGLKQASRQVGGVQIQNRGTLAGNLCNASPAADGAPCLIALDATVELASATGARSLPLRAFLHGNRLTARRPDELVTAIRVPATDPGERSAFLKLGARGYLVISIVSVAANIALDAAGRITRARIAVGACSAVPQRLTTLEARLVGAPVAMAASRVSVDDLAALTPIDDVRATADYRRHAALTLVRRALDGLASPMQDRAA
jgi:CO/xanthine dehydrogenase FAD-binding subunit